MVVTVMYSTAVMLLGTTLSYGCDDISYNSFYSLRL